MAAPQDVPPTDPPRSSDPLPDPEELARYEQVVPGLAAHIVWEQFAARRRREVFTFVITLVALAGSFYLGARTGSTLALLFVPLAASIVPQMLLFYFSDRD